MQYEVETPKEYFQMLEDDWKKEKLQKVRSLILHYGPELKERIEYKMLAYGDGTKNLFHLNAQKSYVSLYVGDIDKIENSRALLKEFNLGKGCIRIKRSIDLTDTRIDEFITKTIAVFRAGEDTDC